MTSSIPNFAFFVLLLPFDLLTGMSRAETAMPPSFLSTIENKQPLHLVDGSIHDWKIIAMKND